MTIYVSNLGFSVRDDELKRLFKDFGIVSSAKVIIDKFSNQSRGFGFVEIQDEVAAEKAVRELNGIMMEGRSIKVSEARAHRGGQNLKSNLY